MKVICSSNDPGAMADHQRSRAVAFETAYPLTVGKEYSVVGMSITENVFYFLVQEDWGGPCFAPAGMFELVSAPIPPGWHFALRSGVRASGRDLWADPIVALWGYRELVEPGEHLTNLLEHEQVALAVFRAHVVAT